MPAQKRMSYNNLYNKQNQYPSSTTKTLPPAEDRPSQISIGNSPGTETLAPAFQREVSRNALLGGTPGRAPRMCDGRYSSSKAPV